MNAENKPVIIIGAGGHAKVVLAALLAMGKQVIGLTDAAAELFNSTILGHAVLGNDQAVLASYGPEAVDLANGLGSTSDTTVRQTVFERFSKMGYIFPPVSHPAAVIAQEVSIGEGAQIMAGAVVQPGTSIAANVIVNTRASIDHDCYIGAHSHVAPGATLSGNVSVGQGCHIGTGAIVIQAICIGANTLVGAGTTVIDSTPDGARVIDQARRGKKT